MMIVCKVLLQGLLVGEVLGCLCYKPGNNAFERISTWCRIFQLAWSTITQLLFNRKRCCECLHIHNLPKRKLASLFLLICSWSSSWDSYFLPWNFVHRYLLPQPNDFLILRNNDKLFSKIERGEKPPQNIYIYIYYAAPTESSVIFRGPTS